MKLTTVPEQLQQFELGDTGRITIYDCLKYFSIDEKLSGQDQWYCRVCKEHVDAQKKMEVYKAPEFLIIHLKRFDHQRNSIFGGTRKLTDHVDFPVHGLNMTPFLVSNQVKRPEGGATPPMLYDLYAVSN